MSELRQKFEILENIKDILNDKEISFVHETNNYGNSLYETFVPEEIIFLNGAWYAFQEQQEKIDAVLSVISQAEKYQDRTLFGLCDELKELLK